ncbi:VapE domain-containing protein [Leptolyngbya sp. CCNP1308]|uniref:VapE domain-containing protein n=1 Tax=Leptolyngbya sp. CCNP1308 TaxID=3110255 RepID=UPI002B21B736|nr:VapE domain-containing protein [Leptolyngbya sp. CCNP1308]MEA5452031.1 VapE domain-containing protein [Leptolyngbya sp. CCNP1308]
MSTLQQLELLGYGPGDRVNYRAFLPGAKDSGRKASAVLPNLPSELGQWQIEGRGVYVVVNSGGHKDAEITQCRAVFYEHDSVKADGLVKLQAMFPDETFEIKPREPGDKEDQWFVPKRVQIHLWAALGLPEPTFQVDTGGKSIHNYWVLTEPVTPGQWRSLQADLLEFADGDCTLKNPSRVMRLAGYTHAETGQQAQVIAAGGQRYDYATLRAIVPQQQVQQRSSWADFDKSFTLPWPGAVPLEACLSKPNRALLAEGVSEGGRNDGGAKLARDLLGTADYLHSLGQRFDGDPRGLFELYCDRCHPPLEDSERETIWRSAESTSPGPSLSPELIDGCIKGAAWRTTKGEPQGVAAPAAEKRDRPKAVEKKAPAVAEAPKLAIKFRAVEAFLGEHLTYNELTNQIELDGEVIEDPADLRLTLALDHGLSVSQSDCEAIVKRLAKTNSYHPVKDYLEACSREHGTSTAILNALAERYFGCSEPIYQTFLRKTLVGAVARIFDPGCKVDTALILQGAQGFGKSSFFRVLAGQPWFDDSMGAATSEKDERLKLHQFWFLEWGELEAVFKRKDIAAVKAFLSCQIDTVRPPYGRNAISLKRRSIIVGSTNQDEFLTDNTGNRRFWVVPVRKRVDLGLLAQERDRIWAAAVALYHAGEACYLSANEEAIAAEFNESYKTDDPWTSTISLYLKENSRGEITTAEILTHGLRIEVGQQNRSHEMRVGEILKTLGWLRTERRTEFDGRRRRVWVEPDPVPHQIPTSEVGPGRDNVGTAPKSPAYIGFSDSSQPTQPQTPNLEVCSNGHSPPPPPDKFEPLTDQEYAELIGGNYGQT